MSDDELPDIEIEPTRAPTRKVTAAGVGGAAATIVVIGIQMFTGAEIPMGLEAALATVFAFGAGYMTSED